ncbi:MAG: acetolactate synthase small subunit [Candidatus Ancaeobacter aquaticus]|nr:acetolactate synthase small subunit [Candidatus Ancaeobacter aquaticus]
MRHTISVLVENKSGVLAAAVGLFSGRGFNIDSLTVGETQDPSTSRMTIVVRGDDKVLEQVNKQLNKLIDVIKVQDFTSVDFIETELVLIKINASEKTRSEIIQIVDIYKAKIVDVGPHVITIEVTGIESKIEAIVELLSSFGIKEMVRTGKIAIARK